MLRKAKGFNPIPVVITSYKGLRLKRSERSNSGEKITVQT
jgi:hypothetical protein